MLQARGSLAGEEAGGGRSGGDAEAFLGRLRAGPSIPLHARGPTLLGLPPSWRCPLYLCPCPRVQTVGTSPVPILQQAPEWAVKAWEEGALQREALQTGWRGRQPRRRKPTKNQALPGDASCRQMDIWINIKVINQISPLSIMNDTI